MNRYAKVLQNAKQREYENGLWDGLRMGLNLCAIALNHEFAFGEERLKKLETAVNVLVNEVIDIDDPLLAKRRIETAVKQIRKDAYGKDEDMYGKHNRP